MPSNGFLLRFMNGRERQWEIYAAEWTVLMHP